ncbi:MAG: lysylphosphatidylglycerol synthase transmembrane domain-containing protein [Acidilobus sp.]
MIGLGDVVNAVHYLKETGLAVAFGSAVNLVLTLLWALRWRTGLRFLGLRTSYVQALEAITSSFPIGTILPGNKVAQEAFRIAYIRASPSERGKVISATTMEWVSEGVVVAALLLVALIMKRPIAVLGLISIAETEGRPHSWLRKALDDFISDLKLLASNGKIMALYLGLSAIIIMLDMFKVAYMLVLLGYVPTMIDVLIIYIVLRLSSLAPTPAGLGVFEAGAFAVLALIGVPAETAALYIVA